MGSSDHACMQALLASYFLCLRASGPLAAARAREDLQVAASIARGSARLMLRSVASELDCALAVLLVEASNSCKNPASLLSDAPPLQLPPLKLGQASLDLQLAQLCQDLGNQLAAWQQVGRIENGPKQAGSDATCRRREE